jgi:hypothetical protein
LKLLDIAELDARTDLLRGQRGRMPQDNELAENRTEQTAVSEEAKDLQLRVDDLTRAQRKADADVEQVKARQQRDQQRMDSGAITSPKDLEAMQHELVSLDRRVTELEDAELEVMEELETAQGELKTFKNRLDALGARADDLTAQRDEALARIDAELASLVAQRKVSTDGMPADLMALYDKLRAQKGGVAAALLRARRCEGCSLELNPADLAVIAKSPVDEVVRCEECNRILVRTGESGI